MTVLATEKHGSVARLNLMLSGYSALELRCIELRYSLPEMIVTARTTITVRLAIHHHTDAALAALVGKETANIA
jgi:hypothetical protein